MNAEIVVRNHTLLFEQLQEPKKKGKRIVFTNGCFDILHAGHVRYLTSAASCGDILVVGINSDLSVKKIKGPKRPIVPEHQRAEVLSGLRCVDFVTLFDEPDPLNLIRLIVPDVLVKGADWPENEIIGADFVKSRGGEIKRIEVVPEISTSAIINLILEKYAG
jgi:D-beta-D-heptose 7-phosphate kinase/D-beta-D-heptose 1-phosphate adenosyltransferase